MGALDGVVVADFSRVLAGPYATMTLGDLGASVIKVERPGTGDDTRSWGPPWSGDTSTYYLGLNRNKKSIALDLTDPADLAVALKLARNADVVVQNFRPGTLDRFGLGAEQLLGERPTLIYCSITGFGDSGAAAKMPGYDLLVQAASGLMSITGEPDGQPLKVGVALVDHICALHSVVGILAALRHRERTGIGQHVQVSLMGTALAALLNQSSGFAVAGVVPTRLGNRHPSIAPYQTFTTGDGHLVLACGNDAQFEKVAIIAGSPELASDARFATNPQRVANIDELEGILTEAFSRRTAVELAAELNEVGVPAGTIHDVSGAFELADRLGLDPVDEFPQDDGRVFRSVASPIRLSATPTEVRMTPPRLGQQEKEIRRWLESLDD